MVDLGDFVPVVAAGAAAALIASHVSGSTSARQATRNITVEFTGPNPSNEDPTAPAGPNRGEPAGTSTSDDPTQPSGSSGSTSGRSSTPVTYGPSDNVSLADLNRIGVAGGNLGSEGSVDYTPTTGTGF